MKTLQETLKSWREGRKADAYASYKQDEGSMNINFKTFCKLFPSVVAKDDERIKIEKADAKFKD